MAGRAQESSSARFVGAVRRMCSQEALFPRGSRALVMVSGGQDSLALLEVLAGGLVSPHGPSEVSALHVNHHLRGRESEDDERLVRSHCARLGVDLTVVDGGVEKSAGNVQEEARTVRRSAALDVAARRGCDRIALGHTLDDQVETMLYRMGRYGGLAALRAMLVCDPPWVRPLMGLRRADTGLFCRERGLEYAVDRGNAYPGYARTGVRERVLPAWEEVLPGAAKAAARTAEVAAEVERLVAETLDVTGMDLDSRQLEVPRLRALPDPLRRLVFHSWLGRREGLDVTRRDVLALDDLLSSEGSVSVDLGSGWKAMREYDRLSLVAVEDGPLPEEGAEVSLSLPGSVTWCGVHIRAEWADRFRAPDPSREVFLDADALVGRLVVRGVRPGDTVRPLGAGGTRKLQDVLVDLRVPAGRRGRVPLVVCDDTIVWVCGLLSAEQGRITAQTQRLAKITVE